MSSVVCEPKTFCSVVSHTVPSRDTNRVGRSPHRGLDVLTYLSVRTVVKRYFARRLEQGKDVAMLWWLSLLSAASCGASPEGWVRQVLQIKAICNV